VGFLVGFMGLKKKTGGFFGSGCLKTTLSTTRLHHDAEPYTEPVSPSKHKAAVYSNPCKDCPLQYIGEIKISLFIGKKSRPS